MSRVGGGQNRFSSKKSFMAQRVFQASPVGTVNSPPRVFPALKSLCAQRLFATGPPSSTFPGRALGAEGAFPPLRDAAHVTGAPGLGCPSLPCRGTRVASAGRFPRKSPCVPRGFPSSRGRNGKFPTRRFPCPKTPCVPRDFCGSRPLWPPRAPSRPLLRPTLHVMEGARAPCAVRGPRLRVTRRAPALGESLPYPFP